MSRVLPSRWASRCVIALRIAKALKASIYRQTCRSGQYPRSAWAPGRDRLLPPTNPLTG
jgi:hypothetical protein